VASSTADEVRTGHRVAVVTGAAGGIGTAVAIALAADGFAIVAADLDGAGAEATARRIETGGGQAVGLQVDVAQRASVDALGSAIFQHFDRIDALVNNAGIIDYAPVLTLTEASWDRVLAVNLKGAFLMAQLAAAAMVERGNAGVIVNVTSISAELPEPDCIHYGVSKAGLAYLTRTLALDLAAHGIRVAAVAPGTIQTPMNEALLRGSGVVERRLATIPMRRLGAPADIASAVSFLVSDAASYVTGSTLYVEGGMMLVR
jgi:NAD(P)-dependent dehydrogenase (short-subunit alcohol dehydrogenase family)